MTTSAMDGEARLAPPVGEERVTINCSSSSSTSSSMGSTVIQSKSPSTDPGGKLNTKSNDMSGEIKSLPNTERKNYTMHECIASNSWNLTLIPAVSFIAFNVTLICCAVPVGDSTLLNSAHTEVFILSSVV